MAVLDKERAKTLYMQKGVLDRKQALWSLPLDTSLPILLRITSVAL